MADIPEFLLVHQVQVETATGDGPYGTTYADPESVWGFASDVRQLVRNKAGDEVVSETTFITTLDQDSKFADDSRVTVNGRKTYVIKAARQDDAGQFGVPQHLEVALQ